MKTILLLILFIFIAPLLIGYFAGRSGKSKSDLVQLATMAGLLILFILYLVFIDKEPKKKQTQKPPPSSAQSSNCNVTVQTPSQDFDSQNDNSGSYSQNGRDVAGESEQLHCNVTCIHDDYSIYEEEKGEQHANGNEAYTCDPAMEYPHQDHQPSRP